jgi:hypothetical protein
VVVKDVGYVVGLAAGEETFIEEAECKSAIGHASFEAQMENSRKTKSKRVT